MSVRVRLAPSPTGPLHVGTARTALFNYLFAKGHDGTFLLRSEDTDRERSKPEFEAEILAGLMWLGLVWKEGPDVGGPHAPYRQSERMSLYQQAAEQLLKSGAAEERDGAIVFRSRPEGPVVVDDLIHGKVSFPARELEDFVIVKSDKTPLFHLTVVVDDAAMGITHVIRGEDHLSNTPKHLLLQEALGLPTPQYAHLPLLLDAQRKKLSKRSGETSLLVYRDQGYLPEAMVNFLALLGWNPKTTEEVFLIEELVERFDLAGVQKGGAVFDRKKLDWLQREHLRRLSLETLGQRVTPFLERAGLQNANRVVTERALDVWRERGGTLGTFAESMRFCFAEPALNAADLPWRGSSSADAEAALDFGVKVLETFPAETWDSTRDIQEALFALCERLGKGRGEILWPMRVALTGLRESPGPHEVAWILGREETLRRLARSRRMLSG